MAAMGTPSIYIYAHTEKSRAKIRALSEGELGGAGDLFVCCVCVCCVSTRLGSRSASYHRAYKEIDDDDDDDDEELRLLLSCPLLSSSS